MTTIAEIEDNPAWLPQQIDPNRRMIQFVRYAQNDFSSYEFLANRKGLAEAWLPITDLAAIKSPLRLPRFIFHSGFCRSTLLLRSLAHSPKIVGLNEPEILNSLERLENPDPRLVHVILCLLFRSHGDATEVVIKPSNFPNRLIPYLLSSHEDSRAILMTCTLKEYLRAIVRKSLHGRLFGRQAYLIASSYAAKDSYFASKIPGMSDLQVSALGWLLTQDWFEKILSGKHKDRVRFLQSNDLIEQRKKTLMSVGGHLNLGLAETEIQNLSESRVFDIDAKTGLRYEAKKKQDAKRTGGIVVVEEIAEVDDWIKELAKAYHINLERKPSLLPS